MYLSPSVRNLLSTKEYNVGCSGGRPKGTGAGDGDGYCASRQFRR